MTPGPRAPPTACRETTKYTPAQPTDVVNMSEAILSGRVIKSHGQGGANCRYCYESTVYTQVGSGAEGGGSTDLTTIGPTNLQPLDVPLLRASRRHLRHVCRRGRLFRAQAFSANCSARRGGVTYADIGEAIANASAIGTI
jgi:hypothetical protein